jgi:hypothetical protein
MVDAKVRNRFSILAIGVVLIGVLSVILTFIVVVPAHDGSHDEHFAIALAIIAAAQYASAVSALFAFAGLAIASFAVFGRGERGAVALLACLMALAFAVVTVIACVRAW